MPTVGLWRIQLAPAVDESRQEVWIASDAEQTLVRLLYSRSVPWNLL